MTFSSRTRVLDAWGLNDEQRAAVVHEGGPMLVLAGAGSGKTRVITCRIADLLQRRGAPPSSILALTFTNRAAREMYARVAQLVGAPQPQMTISTFHSACARWLRRDGHVLGLSPNYSILDDDDQLVLLRRTAQELGMPDDRASLKSYRRRIDRIHHRALTTQEAHELAVGREAEELAMINERYHAMLRASNACDFGSLITSMVHLLESGGALAESYRSRFRHILVDEFQDTNVAQFRLIRALATDGGDVVVVGDDDQAIYGWRGATVENVRRFEHEFQAKRVVLDRNYRSTPEILGAANVVARGIPDRMPKTLRPMRSSDLPPSIFVGRNDREEAEFVVRSISQALHDGHLHGSDIAVFYRTNAQSRVLEEALRGSGIAHDVVGNAGFFERREIKDLLGYLRIASNPHDDAAFERIVNTPSRGIGKGTLLLLQEARLSGAATSLRGALPLLETLPQRRLTKRTREGIRHLENLLVQLEYMSERASVQEITQTVLVETQYREWIAQREPDTADDRARNVDELLSAAAEFDERHDGDHALTAFLEHITLQSAADTMSDTVAPVQLMTVHTAKGLEFPLVFVTGLEEELFPLMRRRDPEADDAQLPEERRLAYVAFTRAEDRLVLTCAKERRLHGQPKRNRASRFLDEIINDGAFAWSPQSAMTTLEWHPDRRPRGFGNFGSPDAATALPASDFDQRPWQERMDVKGGDPIPRDGVIFDDSHYPEERVQAAGRLAGRRARHKLFGEGIIREADPSGDRIRLLIDFPQRGAKKVIKDYVDILDD